MADTGANAAGEKLWTPANVVTVFRICLVPVFVVALISPWPQWFPVWENAALWKPWIAAGIFILIAATDALDGYLARSRNEVTDFGKFMDPLADKILVMAALISLVELNVLPSWVVLIILAREFIVSGLRMLAAVQGKVIAASYIGKAKTVTQIIAIVLFIIKDSEVITSFSAVLASPLYLISWAMMFVALGLTVYSMVDYLSKSRELFTGNKSTPKMANACEATVSCESLAEKVIHRYKEADKTISTAESLTGGLIGSSLTSVPGSSSVYKGGFVTYMTELKEELVDVSHEVIKQDGVVSESVALQMAEGARKHAQSSAAIAVTGIAGPGGEEPGKPVGTVWIAYADEYKSYAKRFVFEGNRQTVRRSTAEQALIMLLAEI